jgi:hypothetical protein
MALLMAISWNKNPELLVEYSPRGITGTEKDNRPLGLNPERKARREANLGQRT